MKKALLALTAAAVVAVPAAAGAQEYQVPGSGTGQTQTQTGKLKRVHHFGGKVLSVDAAAGTLSVQIGGRRGGPGGGGGCHRGEGGQGGQGAQGESQGNGSQARASHKGRGGQSQTVTVKVDASTDISRDDADATLASIVAGDKVDVIIKTPTRTNLTDALNTPALSVEAYPAGEHGGGHDES